MMEQQPQQSKLAMAAFIRAQIGNVVERTVGGLPTFRGETFDFSQKRFTRVYRFDEKSRAVFPRPSITRAERVRARSWF